MKKILGLICLLTLTFSTHAEQQTSRQSVETLMELTEVSKMMDAMHTQISAMFSGMSKQLGISAQEKPAFDKYMKKVGELLKNDMNWQLFKEPIIDIYTKHFSQEEINGLIAFYRSELGQSMTKKMPLIMQDSMLMSQQIMQQFMPKIQALAMEMKQEIESTRQTEKGE